MAQKPSLPKGTRDFGPQQMGKRNYLLGIIRSVFERYGFMPLETPSMENLSVLMGKYGDEGDQLLFKILNSGDFLKSSSEKDFAEGSKQLMPKIAEKGLRYDLTVPFARYVVMNQHELAFPFKRYQIQPVWRADRPQKGRYREFFQCDADVIGTDSLLCEAEIVLMIHEVFAELGLQDFLVKINNRKVLSGLVEVLGAAGKETSFCVAIDKLDKIGTDKVMEELQENGFSEEALVRLRPLLAMQAEGKTSLESLKEILYTSETGMQGLSELEEIFMMVAAYGLESPRLELDVTLARGLSYYTGAIFEVKPTSVQMGSICGGGRYDDLTGVFGLKGLSGVGISFGIDRIYDVLEELQLFPETSLRSTEVLVTNFDVDSQRAGIGLVSRLRKAGLRAELYPESAKLKKQMAYANKKGIPYVLLLGSEELESGKLTLKDMEKGQQEPIAQERLEARLQELLR